LRYTKPHSSRDLPHDTAELARALLGTIVVRDDKRGRVSGRIVETEAYEIGDPASHAYIGKRPRTVSMFLAPFHAYVYFIYGSYFCFNVSSEPEDHGAAVLVRALEPVEGIDIMQARRSTTRLRDLCSGPGRLCSALAIDRSLDGVYLLKKGPLWLAPGDPPKRIGKSVRIGVTSAHERRLRFYERDNPHVSGPRSLSP
jgi:DNA-3-methyladenine glycosylase